MKEKVSFVTGSRADYGIVRNFLKLLNEDERIDLSVLVTGALLSDEYGSQAGLIYQDGFKVGAEIEIPIDPTSNRGVVHSMAAALDKFGNYFAVRRPELLILLGDRYEIFSVAAAAAMNKIPILHIHGGEATFGNYDEFIRHSITKMSLFHFTATEEFRRRVIQLGESPDRVYNLGALGAENCLHIDETQVPVEVSSLKGEKYFVVLFHPETLTNISVQGQIEELLKAVDAYKNYKFIFLGSNADTNSNIIRSKVREYTERNKNCIYFENLPTSVYHYLLKYSMGLLGNSSSGLIEAPSLQTYTVNIGDRQEGRVRGKSVIDVACRMDEIIGAMKKIIKKNKDEIIINPYYKENAARNYYITTIKLLEELESGVYTHPKMFYDLNFHLKPL